MAHLCLFIVVTGPFLRAKKIHSADLGQTNIHTDCGDFFGVCSALTILVSNGKKMFLNTLGGEYMER